MIAMITEKNHLFSYLSSSYQQEKSASSKAWILNMQSNISVDWISTRRENMSQPQKYTFLVKRARKLKDNFTFRDYPQNRNQSATRIVKPTLETTNVKDIC